MDFANSHEKFWDEISAKEPVELAKNANVLYLEKENSFKVRLIDDNYIVNLNARSIVQENSLIQTDFTVKVIMVTYLSLAGSHVLSGSWMTEQLLPSGSVFFRGVNSLPTQKVTGFYHNDLQKLKKRSFQLGGKEIKANADLGVEFLLLPNFPMRMQYWKQDDEFPAKVSFYFDKYSDKFLNLDTVGALIGLLVKKLTE